MNKKLRKKYKNIKKDLKTELLCGHLIFFHSAFFTLMLPYVINIHPQCMAVLSGKE